MNPVKLVVKLMEDEALVELAEHDLNQRMSTYALPVPRRISRTVISSPRSSIVLRRVIMLSSSDMTSRAK